MCCLFGFYNYSGKPIPDLSNLTNHLARKATARGTDATGISYCENRKLKIYKEPKSAELLKFRHSDSIVCLTGHTRHATQGDRKDNRNNHPFEGYCKNNRFALSHNGVLWNDVELKRKHRLPITKIETDSYVAVQLLEHKKLLNAEAIRFMAESLRGSFAFSILDNSNCLWLVRGDSPLSMVHFPKYGLYVYASTDEILYQALVETKLLEEIKKGHFEEVSIKAGDILKIENDGNIVKEKFTYEDYSDYGLGWWEYDSISPSGKDKYLMDLKSIAVYHGYSPEEIDELVSCGFTPEEIEDYIYCM